MARYLGDRLMPLLTVGARRAVGRARYGEPAGAATVFRSTWTNGTGQSATNLTDGSLWNASGFCSHAEGSRVLEVVTAASVSFGGVGNPLWVKLFDVPPEAGCGQVEWIDGIPESTDHWGRFYFRNRDTAMIASHNFAQNFGVGDPGNIQWVFFNRHGFADGWEMLFRGRHVGGTYPYNEWHLQSSADPQVRIRLAHDTWYRYEWSVTYVSGGTRMQLRPRLYNAAGTLMYDENNFYQQDTPGQGVSTLKAWYDLGNSFTIGSLDFARNFGIGNEGRNPGVASNGWYIADFAISTTGWCGGQAV